MNEKSFKTYNYLLEQLESGHWDDESKFPGARKLALDAGCGFPLMQTVIEILCQQGILVTKARSGTYVAKNWRQRLLASNIFIVHPDLRRIIISRKNSLPDGFRISKEFNSGMFEIRVSHYLLSHHEEYHDLAEIFDKLYPDKSDFFEKAIAPFYVGKKLCGIPFIFSPRIMLCNRKMFKEASCPLPEENWSWDEFITTIKKLKEKFPDRNIMSLADSINDWSTFLFRFGGKIYVPDSDDPVRIDYPDSIKALQSYAKLLKKINVNGKTKNIDFNDYALNFSPRQKIYPNAEDEINKNFHPVKLPLPTAGLDTNNQAVDLLCIRKECSDIDLMKDFLKFMLSNKVQDFIGDIGYGLPIRKSSAHKLKSSNSPLLKLFCSEIKNISNEYHIFSPELYRMISDGVSLSLREKSDQKIAESLHELGQALRMFLKIENFAQNNHCN